MEQSFGQGYVLEERAPNILVGRLLTLIEAIGLPESQEKSLKSLIQQEIWEGFSRWGELIDSGTHNAARESVRKYIESGGGFASGNPG